MLRRERVVVRKVAQRDVRRGHFPCSPSSFAPVMHACPEVAWQHHLWPEVLELNLAHFASVCLQQAHKASDGNTFYRFKLPRCHLYLNSTVLLGRVVQSRVKLT